MSGAQEQGEGERPPSESPRGVVRGEREWSQWERQKIEAYRKEHPDAQPGRPTTEEGSPPT